MTNLTDAQLTALSIEHYPNPDDPDGCWSCCEAWVCPTAIALAELRQVREQKRYSDAGFASTLKRAVDRIGALLDENERLRDALKAITSEEGAYMACSDLPWCQASGSGPGSHHAEDCAVGIALAALASVKETK